MQNVTEKVKNIKLLLLDVDGVLTDGTIYYADNGVEMRRYHLHDGMGLKLLRKNGIDVGIISAKNSSNIEKRAEDLGIKHLYLGYDHKLLAYEKIKQKTGYTDADIAFIGDDLVDLPLLKRVGVSATVPQATAFIRAHVDIVTEKKGGKGAVRELCEIILDAKGMLQATLQPYLDE